MALDRKKYKRVTIDLPIEHYKAIEWYIKNEKLRPPVSVGRLCKIWIEGSMEDIIEWYRGRNKK